MQEQSGLDTPAALQIRQCTILICKQSLFKSIQEKGRTKVLTAIPHIPGK
jgi:hypothetical protein